MRCATTARVSRSAASRPSACSRCRASGCVPACSSIRPRSARIAPAPAASARPNRRRCTRCAPSRRKACAAGRARSPSACRPTWRSTCSTRSATPCRTSRSATASRCPIEADDELHAADCEIERVRGGRRDERDRARNWRAPATTRWRPRLGRATKPTRSTTASRPWQAIGRRDATRTRMAKAATAVAGAAGGAGGAAVATAKAKRRIRPQSPPTRTERATTGRRPRTDHRLNGADRRGSRPIAKAMPAKAIVHRPRRDGESRAGTIAATRPPSSRTPGWPSASPRERRGRAGRPMRRAARGVARGAIALRAYHGDEFRASPQDRARRRADGMPAARPAGRRDICRSSARPTIPARR